MKVKTLSLTNYRGFERLEIEFHPQVNVIAGINGVGKSSILHALSVAFSRALPQMTTATRNPQRFDDEDITEGQAVLDIGLGFDIHGEAAQIIMQRVQMPEDRKAEWQVRLDDIELQRIGSSISRIPRHLQEEQRTLKANIDGDRDIYSLVLENIQTDAQRKDSEKAARGDHTKTQRTGGLDDVERKIADTLRDFRAKENQPLIVYYAPLRFTSSRIRTLPDGSPLGTSRAFDQALEEREISFREFMHWYRWLEQDDNKATQRQRNALRKTLQKAVTNFIPEFKELKLQEQPKLKFMVRKDAQWLSLDQLSDGERGLLGLVFDLARRLALANPKAKEPLKTGQAVVLIDEVELHLHPSWQRRVMKQLHDTFPLCQFIVTSHSPQVIGEVASQSVRFLEPDGERMMCWIPDQTVGLDANLILDLMGADSINEKFRLEIRDAGKLVQENDLAAAREKLKQIRLEINPTHPEQVSNPDIIRLEASIRFLEVPVDSD